MRYNMPRFDIQDIVGTSSEVKPTNIRPGSTFTETDTGKRYLLTSEGWTRVGGAWRLWDGEEPLIDATTKKWIVDCEIYAKTEVTELADSPVMECWRFWRKGDPAVGILKAPMYLGGVSTEYNEDVLETTGCGALEIPSLTPEEGVSVDADVTYYPYDAATLDDVVNFDISLAFNDETQLDRIMVWIYDETAQSE